MTDTIFNHCSTDYGVWVENNGTRFKDLYSIKTADGAVFKYATPNGLGWHVQREVDMTKEEYDACTDKDQIRYVPLAESKYLDRESMRIENEHVVELALLPDDEAPPYWWWETGLQRIANNRRDFASRLSPNEPFIPELDPVRAVGKYISIAVVSKKEKPILIAGLEFDNPSVPYARYAGPVRFETPEFVREGKTFKFSNELKIELIPEFLSGGLLQSYFQRGWRFKAVVEINTSVVNYQVFGFFESELKSLEVTKVGRGATPDFKNLKVKGRLHFSFYYDKKE